MLLPVLGLLNIFFMRYTLIADYWQYFALPAPIALVVGLAAYAVRGRSAGVRRLAQACALAVVLGLCLLSLRRQQAFRSEEALWEDTIQKNPKASIAYNSLGVLYGNRGEAARGEKYLRRAIALDPDNFEALSNLARSLHSSGRTTESVALLEEALGKKPDMVELHKNLAVAYIAQGRRKEAIGELQLVLQANPGALEVRTELARLYALTGERQKAREELGRVLAQRPKDARAQAYLRQLDEPTSAPR
jgi:Flp pilus assembly protein TadD